MRVSGRVLMVMCWCVLVIWDWMLCEKLCVGLFLVLLRLLCMLF